MQTILREWGPLIMRVCLSALFIVSGTGMLFSFGQTAAFIGSIVPMGTLAAAIVIAVKVGGGLMLLLGYKGEWAAWALIGFVMVTIVVAHSNFADANQLTQALKNLGIIGGLLAVIIHGTGPMSVGAMRKTDVNIA